MLRDLSKPLRTVFRWQLAVTAALTLIGAILAGLPGALSAMLGGTVSVCAGWASAAVASKHRARSAGEVLIGALTAEGVKIGLAVFLLWLVLANYAEVRVGVLLASFVTTMLIFAMAFFVREY